MAYDTPYRKNAISQAGIGWRAPHHRAVLEQRPRVGFLEVHAENHMGGGRRSAVLTEARRHYAISVHGVGLSLGSVEPCLVSEHVAWCRQDGVYLNDLLPLPYTDEALEVLVRNIDRVQSRIRRAILMENPSTYLEFRHSTMPEGEFLAEMARRSGCGLLLDVNNLYVNERNHGHPARAVIGALHPCVVAEIHVAGHHVAKVGDATILIDNHGAEVADPVWALYAEAAARFSTAATLVEWDTAIPELAALLAEAEKANERRSVSTKEADLVHLG